jgi:hypothetical protein
MTAPSQALHLLGLAVALDRDGQTADALATARRAIDLDRSLSQLHDAGVFFVPAGDISYYEALYALAQARPADAERAFDQFIALCPKSPYVARAHAHLGQLRAPPSEAVRPVQGGVVGGGGVALGSAELDAALAPRRQAIARCLPGGGPLLLTIRVAEDGTVGLSNRPSARMSSDLEACLREAIRGLSLRRTGHARRFLYRVIGG